jgi:squamous cell carcinoma antigen recognized by T-cells 3
LKVLSPGDGISTALIEFESKEDAEFAQSRDGKDFDGSTIEVQIGTGSTLYVTNYPPTADENYIHDLFSKVRKPVLHIGLILITVQYGEIISIRFPSLKFNTHRRFCYVQFKDNASAYAALELNETAVDGKAGKLRLVVKISDPTHKQDRSGAMQEDREIYVAGIHYNVSEDDLKGLFSKFGSIERVRIPRKVNGNSRGFGYVVFESKVLPPITFLRARSNETIGSSSVRPCSEPNNLHRPHHIRRSLSSQRRSETHSCQSSPHIQPPPTKLITY